MKTYGILDLLTLVAKLLAPFVDPLRAEFARNPAPAAPPIPEPAPAQLSEVVPAPTAPAEVVPVAEPVVIVARVSAEVAAALANMQRGGDRKSADQSRNSDFDPPPVTQTEAAKRLNVHRDTVVKAEDAQADAPEPLFIRKPAGKKFRYVAAPPNARGTTYRKLVTGRRVKYEPCR